MLGLNLISIIACVCYTITHTQAEGLGTTRLLRRGFRFSWQARLPCDSQKSYTEISFVVPVRGYFSSFLVPGRDPDPHEFLFLLFPKCLRASRR